METILGCTQREGEKRSGDFLCLLGMHILFMNSIYGMYKINFLAETELIIRLN